MVLQVEAVSATAGGQVDITAAIHLQLPILAQGLAPPSPTAASEPERHEEEQPQPPAPTTAQQHAGSVQVVMEHLLESQQARWQDGSSVAGSVNGGSRPDSPRGREAQAGLRDAVFDITAPRDWTAQLQDPPGTCQPKHSQQHRAAVSPRRSSMPAADDA